MKVKLKNILFFFSAVLLFGVTLCFNATALDATGNCGAEGSNVTWKYNSETKELVISGNGEMKDFGRDGYYNDKSTSVFAKCDIGSLVIEEGVTKIGEYAFDKCKGPVSITVKNKNADISATALMYTEWYESQPDGLVYIDDILFRYKGKMQNDITLSVKEGTVSINTRAFDSCNNNNIKAVILPESLRHIGAYAFSNFDITELIIPDNVTSIGTGAFRNCIELKSIRLPQGITKMENGVLSNCKSLESITFPESLTDPGIGALEGCTSLKSVTLPKAVTKVSHSMFKDCKNLTDVKFEGKVTTIGGNTFEGCVSLKSIEIPDTVSNINGAVFKGCTALESITLPEGITFIGTDTFYGCKALKSVTLKGKITSIGETAFAYCINLEKFSMPETVKEIGLGAFYYCSKIEKITLKEGIKTIEPSTFTGCTSLTEVVLPKSVERISMGAFANCPELGLIVIPNPDCDIYYYAEFNRDPAIGKHTTICSDFGGKVEAFARKWGNLLSKTENPYDVDIPEGVVYNIDNSDPDNLKAYVAINQLDEFKFSRVPDTINWVTVTSVGRFMPEDKYKVRAVYFPKTVKKIDSYIFNGSDELVSIYFGGTEEEWNAIEFDGDASLWEMNKAKKYFNSKGPKEDPNHEHNYVFEALNYADCTVEGNYKYTCYCGYSYIEKIAKDEHYNGIIKGTPATCTEKGISDGQKCRKCGTVTEEQKEIPALGHSYEKTVTEPTCIAEGYTTYTCFCGDTYTGDKVNATGHKWIVKQGKRICSVCEKTELIASETTTIAPTTKPEETTVPDTEPTTAPSVKPTTVPSTEVTTVSPTEPVTTPSTEPTTIPSEEETTTVHTHTEVIIPSVKATYTSDGLTEGKKCSVCGAVTVKQKKVACKKLGKVKSLKVKSVTATTAKLSWKKVTGAESYTVYYSTNGKKWKTVKATKNSVTIKKLSAAKNYQFKVKAVAGKYSGEVSAVVKKTTKFTTATISKVTSSKKKQATVTWKKVKNASGYVVEYSTSKKFTKKTTKTVTIKKGKTVKTTLKKLKSGKKYYVRVKAYKTVNKKAVYGNFSKVKTVKVK